MNKNHEHVILVKKMKPYDKLGKDSVHILMMVYICSMVDNLGCMKKDFVIICWYLCPLSFVFQ